MKKLNVKNNETAVFAIGGLGEIGKNTYGIQFQDEIIVVDAGIKFPEDDLLGIDYVIPDYSYLIANQQKIKALVITHGHEDHIGGIPYLLQKINVPVYAGPLALALIKSKLEEHGLLRTTELHEIDEDSILKFRKTTVSFFRTTHSIPDTLGVAVKTPSGTIVCTGDYKFDLTPVTNQPPNLQKMAKLGDEGVLCLLSDSTNAEVPNFSISEKQVAYSVQEEFRKTEGRLIVATFASNVHRVQQIIDAAVKFNRKILVFGRSMENNIQVSRKLGYIKCPDRFFIKNDEAKNLPDNEILILCTGSQGEALAALSRIANGTHRQVSIKPGDTVVFSSNPIPGNASSVSKVINKLYRAGARVLTNEAINNLHTSGHASQEEQKLMLLLTRPKYFFPVHGEYRMLKIHAKLFEEVGLTKGNAFVLSNGDSILLHNEEARLGPRIHVDDIYVDGNDITGLSTAVLRDRQILSEDGMVSVLISMDSRGGCLLNKPIIMSRGFVYMQDSKDMIREAELLVSRELSKLLKRKTTFGEIKNTIRDTLAPYFYQKTKRNPMIIPIIMEI